MSGFSIGIGIGIRRPYLTSSGYSNIFPDTSNNLLLESGDNLLLEDGSKLLLEED